MVSCEQPFKSLQETFTASLESFEYMVTMFRSGQEMLYKTIGPEGPWVAYLRKRSKVTVEIFTEDH